MRTRRQELAEAKAAHNHPAYSKMSFVMGCGIQGPGRGSHVTDERGRSFLALFDQYGNQSFGYAHERIVAAVREQLDSSVLNSTKIMFEEVSIRLAERLSELTDGALPYAYFANGGGESIDNALKLARAATGRANIVSAHGCFHGKTFATLAASGRPEHRAVFGPFPEAFTQVPFGDIEALAGAVDGGTAAVLLEPVQAEAGVIVPPPDYLVRVREVCDRAGALLIFDEMQTAFGRCGTFFAHQRFGVTPDLLCIGKAFGGGILALSAVLGTAAVWEVLKTLPSSFGSSLGGNPLACRVGLESIAVASAPEFLTGVEDAGRVIGETLAAAAANHPDLIVEHRGIGMMHGLELRDESLVGLVLGRLLAEGVTSTYSLYNTRVLRVQPPMVISPDELRHGLDVLLGVLAEVSDHRGATGPAATAAGSPLVREVQLPGVRPKEALEALWAAPRLLDPFAAHPDAKAAAASGRHTDPDFAGMLGEDRVVWADETEIRPDGVLLRAEPCWLWDRLQRSAVVRPLADETGSVVEIRVDWDTGSGAYEDMVAGRIGFLAARRLSELIAHAEEQWA
ncbi:aminotransferase class III-fold pyridoxal phosphate-dependent enzyme [Streptomyces sp. NPDC048417]|uniref:aspartate aminotransferase family protein n=1 Tax=Streptomyces sp. NPDC048417 TaxID=3155387 RepID=UPI0034162297